MAVENARTGAPAPAEPALDVRRCPCMGRASPQEKDEAVEAARYFIARAQEAIEAAENARTDEAHAAFYREAETWLYMANRCLRPDLDQPPPAPPPPRRVPGERRSFASDG